jgi:hypothetical protein
MKHNNIADIKISQLKPQQFENLFNVYENEDGLYFYNILKTVNFPQDLNPLFFQRYTIKPKDTWPNISWKMYKNVKLGWLLCSLNGVQDPLKPLKPGDLIKVLAPDYVKEVLAQIRIK